MVCERSAGYRRRPMRRLSWTWIAVLAVSCASAPPPASRPSPLLGDVMPGFEGDTLNGNRIYSSGYEGRVLVVSFVAVDCPACDRSLAAAQAVYADDRELVVVGVVRASDVEQALRLSGRNSVRFPVIIDQDGSLARKFKVEGVPSTFVVDPGGRVRWVGGADLSREALASSVDDLD